jgi:hypothetical protein
MQYVSTTSCDLDKIPSIKDAMFTVDLDQGDDGGTTCCKKRKGIGA